MFFSLTDEIKNAITRIRLCENELFPPKESNDLNLVDIGENDIIAREIPIDESLNAATYISTPILPAEILDMHSMECGIMFLTEFGDNVKRMSHCQLRALNYVLSFFQNHNTTVSIHLFITGRVGVGKHLLLEWL